jgi:Domain of unknown function (DUF4307)
VTAPPPFRRPPDRYDAARRSSRVLVAVTAVVVAVAVVGGAYAFYERRNEGRLAYQVRGYEVLSDTAVRISFEVRLDRGQYGECRVRARGRDGLEKGAEIIPVGPGTGGALVTSYVLTTTSRASTGEVSACLRADRP